jgi:hypothetical protein
MMVKFQLKKHPTHLSKVSRMILIKVDPMMMLTAGITAPARMLTMFADTAVTMRYVSTQFSCLLLGGCHGHLSDGRGQNKL